MAGEAVWLVWPYFSSPNLQNNNSNIWLKYNSNIWLRIQEMFYCTIQLSKFAREACPEHQKVALSMLAKCPRSLNLLPIPHPSKPALLHQHWNANF